MQTLSFPSHKKATGDRATVIYTRDLALALLGYHSLCRRYVSCPLVTGDEVRHAWHDAPKYEVEDDVPVWRSSIRSMTRTPGRAMLRRAFPLLQQMLDVGQGHLVVAGGAASWAVCRPDWHLKPPASMDVDLFFVGLHADLGGDGDTDGMGTCEAAEAIIRELTALVESTAAAGRGLLWCVARTPHCFTMSVGQGSTRRRYQVILRLYPDVASVLLGFDLDCCRVAMLQDSSIVTTGTGAAAVLTGVVPADTSCMSPSWMHRMAKYVRRGWRVVFPHVSMAQLLTVNPCFHAWLRLWSDGLAQPAFRAFLGKGPPPAHQAVEGRLPDPIMGPSDYHACDSLVGAFRCMLRQLLRNQVLYVPIVYAEPNPRAPLPRYVSLDEVLHPYHVPHPCQSDPSLACPQRTYDDCTDWRSLVTWTALYERVAHAYLRQVRPSFVEWLPSGYDFRPLMQRGRDAKADAAVRAVKEARQELTRRWERWVAPVVAQGVPPVRFLVRNPGQQHTSAYQLQAMSPRDVHGRALCRGSWVGVDDEDTRRVALVLYRAFRRHGVPPNVRRRIMVLVGHVWIGNVLCSMLGMIAWRWRD